MGRVGPCGWLRLATLRPPSQRSPRRLDLEDRGKSIPLRDRSQRRRLDAGGRRREARRGAFGGLVVVTEFEYPGQLEVA